MGIIFHFLISMRWLLTLEEQRGPFQYLSLILFGYIPRRKKVGVFNRLAKSKGEGHMRLLE
jgi:hypothetical protein